MEFLKKVIEFIFNRKKPVVVVEEPKLPDPIVIQPTKPVETPAGFVLTKKIAIIVGHGYGDSGAESADGKRNEFEYNSKIAEMISAEKFGPKMKIFWRGRTGIVGVAAEVVAWGADISIELHLNSYNNNARGCEVLVLKGDTKSGTLAKSFAQMFTARFSRVLRRDEGINWIDSGDRGATSLKAVSSVKQSILVEPFFIDNPAEWVPEKDYGKMLIEFIKTI